MSQIVAEIDAGEVSDTGKLRLMLREIRKALKEPYPNLRLTLLKAVARHGEAAQESHAVFEVKYYYQSETVGVEGMVFKTPQALWNFFKNRHLDLPIVTKSQVFTNSKEVEDFIQAKGITKLPPGPKVDKAKSETTLADARKSLEAAKLWDSF